MTDVWSSDLSKGFVLGDWTVRPDRCVLERAEQLQRVEPKVMEVLLYLALNSDVVVRRETLIDEVWRTVVNDEVLSRAISLLRAALEDDPRSPRYVQTIPKLGYRLIVAPQPIAAEPSSIDPDSDTPVPTESPVPRAADATGAAAVFQRADDHRIPLRRTALLVLLAALAALALLRWWSAADSTRPRPVVKADGGDWLDTLLMRDGKADEITSVAVLPFEDLSENAARNHLGDSLTDEIIQSLSRVNGLKVVARRSTSALRDSSQDVRALGNFLNVDSILEGTVKLHEDRIRVTARLSSARDGFVIWAESYDEALGDVFRFQQRFTGVVTEALERVSGIELNIPESSAAPPSLDAYQLFLNGRHLMKLRGDKALRAAVDLFTQALAIDPEFDRARIELARATMLLPYYDEADQEEMFQHALAILDAMEFEDASAEGEAESIRGVIADERWQWIEALAHHKRALELNPADPAIYMGYSQHLSSVGKLGDSLKAAQRAFELDEVSAVINDRLAISWLWVNDELHAAEHFAVGAQLGFSHGFHPGYLVFLHRARRWDELQQMFTHWLERTGHRTDWVAGLFELLRQPLPRSAAALSRVADAADMPPRAELGVWMLLGEFDRAFDCFERFDDKKANLDVQFVFSREAAGFRAHPRFADFTHRIGLDDYWQRFGPPDAES